VINADATRRNRALLEAINAGRVPDFAAGGLVGAPSLPSARFSGTTAGSVTVAPTINVKVEGGSRGPQADRELGAQIATQVEASMRRVVVSELREQMRPGGILRTA
jgi:hypothetical protein